MRACAARALTRSVHHDLNPVNPLAPLRDGQIDVAHLSLPVCEPDITVGPITHVSPIVLALAATHPYAARESITMEDYGDLTFMSHESLIPASMEQTFQPFRTPSGRLIPRGPSVSTWYDILRVVSSGQAVIPLAAENARFYPWPNLVYRPVHDAPPACFAFAWLTTNTNPTIRAFATTAGER